MASGFAPDRRQVYGDLCVLLKGKEHQLLLQATDEEDRSRISIVLSLSEAQDMVKRVVDLLVDAAKAPVKGSE